MDLTICTVTFKSADYLEVNYELIQKLNPDINIHWLICDNSETPLKFSFPATILPRVEPTNDFPLSFINKHSYHHASGLDILLPHIKTRYCLITDNDFFRFRSIDSILLYMDMHDLAAFGSPYIPGKKRILDVPVAFDMLIDTDKIDISKWSFKPGGVATDGLIMDTGFSVYNDLKTNYNVGCTEPFGASKEFDSYSWQKQLYGIHMHAKLHLREGEQLGQRIKSQLRLIREFL